MVVNLSKIASVVWAPKAFSTTIPGQFKRLPFTELNAKLQKCRIALQTAKPWFGNLTKDEYEDGWQDRVKMKAFVGNSEGYARAEWDLIQDDLKYYEYCQEARVVW